MLREKGKNWVIYGEEEEEGEEEEGPLDDSKANNARAIFSLPVVKIFKGHCAFFERKKTLVGFHMGRLTQILGLVLVCLFRGSCQVS